MVMTAIVLAARVMTLNTAHQVSTGNWWRDDLLHDVAEQPGLGARAG